MNNENEFLDWNSGFMAEESSFKLFPEGEYQFVVKNFERKVYDGRSTKIPNGAPYAEIEMEFSGPLGTTTVIDRLYMMKKWQWKLTQFFAGIGQAPVIGQAFNPNWGMVVGSRGIAKLNINKYTNNSGKEVENNQVDEYLAPGAANQVQSTQQPITQQPTQSFNQPAQNQSVQNQPPMQNIPPQTNQQPQNQSFTPGEF